MNHEEFLQKELEWVEINSKSIERLKRAVIREYLNNRITFIKKEKEEIDAAKKRLKKTITKLPQKNDK